MTDRFATPRPARGAEHGVVYRDENEFCAWPFLGGLWLTKAGDVVAAFTRNDCVYTRPDDVHHDVLSVSRGRLTVIRSADKGASWDQAGAKTVFDMATTADQIATNGPPDYSNEPAVDF